MLASLFEGLGNRVGIAGGRVTYFTCHGYASGGRSPSKCPVQTPVVTAMAQRVLIGNQLQLQLAGLLPCISIQQDR